MSEKKPTYIRPQWIEKPRPSRYMPSIFAILSVALSIPIMVFQGTALIALFYLIWLPRAYYKKYWNIIPTKSMLIVVAIVLYGLLSTFWSIERKITFRATLEFASVVTCALIMARTVRVKDLIVGITIGMCVTLMLSIIISGGIQSDEAMTGGLGSKNQVGASAEIGFYCALMCFGVFRSYWKKFVFGLVPLLFFTLCLKLSQSATSNMSLLAMLAITLTGYILTKLPQKFRMPLFITGTVLIVVLVVVGITFNAQELVLKAAGKDATLTGRTDLWAVGIKTGMETPLVGVGTGAFWVIGHPVAEKLWYQFGIYDRMGFHFHNLFINVFVELGFVGAFLWAWLYLSTSTKIALYLVRNGANVETIFYLGMVFMYLVRSATESDTPGPYGTGPLLFFFLVFRVAMLSRQGLEKNAQPVTSVAPPSGKLLSPVSQGKL